jgi:hypothetical protein
MFSHPHVRRAGPAAPLAILILAGTLMAATAAPNPEPRQSAPPSSGQNTQTVETPSVDSGPSCVKARRKLWVEGEGWIVRRVQLC